MKFFKWLKFLLITIAVVGLLSYVMAPYFLKPFDEQALKQAPGNHIKLSQGQLHYRWDGPNQGSIVVLVHGLSTPHFVFEQNTKALVSAGFRVLRFDHFGRGWSERPSARYDADFYDRELLELLDKLGINEPIGLVGLSMGGLISAEFAARHPQRISKLFLLAPAGLDTSSPADVLRIPLIGDWIWRLFGRSILLKTYLARERELPTNELAGDVSVQMQYRGYLDALLATIRNLALSSNSSTFQRLNTAGVPTKAIFGELDTVVLPSSAQSLKSLAPSANITMLPDARHNLAFARHQEVNSLLLEWFTD